MKGRVAGDERQAGPLRQLGNLGGEPAIGGMAMVGDQEGRPVPAEAFAQPLGEALGSPPVTGDERGDHGALRSAGERDAVVEVLGVDHRRRALHPIPGRGQRWPSLGEGAGGGPEGLGSGRRGDRGALPSEAQGWCFAAVGEAGDAQARLALDAGELGGADRPAELAVAAPATGEEADPAGVDEVQLDAHHRANAGLAGGLDEADGAVEPVAVAEAEAPDLQPGRDLDQVAGRGRTLQEGEVGADRQLGEGLA